MESYIQISFLNDFIFCPRSIYFHSLYKNFDPEIYHEDTQVKGKIAHHTIDHKKYSTRKNILQGLMVYSDKYSLCGRIDVFNTKTETLTERKRKVIKIYDGFIFQIYAQYYCMLEMGYSVKNLFIYSLLDNKKYPIPLPSKDSFMDKKFKKLIEEIHNFKLENSFHQNNKKCKKCIYKNLCDYAYAECS